MIVASKCQLSRERERERQTDRENVIDSESGKRRMRETERESKRLIDR